MFLKKIIIFIIVSCVCSFSYATNKCEAKLSGEESSQFETEKTGREYYQSFFESHLQKRSQHVLRTIKCFTGKEESEDCNIIKDSFRDFTKSNYSRMILSLMIFKYSTDVRHESTPGVELIISKREMDAFYKVQDKYDRDKQIERSPMARRWRARKIRTQRSQEKQKNKDKYYKIIRTWPFFQYISSIEGLSEKKLDLVILNAFSKQYNDIQSSLNKFKNENIHDFVYTRSAIEFFMKKNKNYNFEICHFLKVIRNKLDLEEYTDILAYTVAPIALTIGSCIIYTPVGCVIASVGIGVATSLTDIYNQSQEVEYEIIKSNLMISDPKYILEKRESKDLAVSMSSLIFLETFGAYKVFKILRNKR